MSKQLDPKFRFLSLSLSWCQEQEQLWSSLVLVMKLGNITFQAPPCIHGHSVMCSLGVGLGCPQRDVSGWECDIPDCCIVYLAPRWQDNTSQMASPKSDNATDIRSSP